MCGIAGFNLSKEYAAEHIPDSERMLSLVEQAWLYNLHRGYDAAGYFRTDLKSGEVRAFKDAGPATDILKDSKGIDPSNVLAAHTRAATKGATEDNRNNHPVYVNGVYVTHNGTITNHEIIKSYGHKYLNIPDHEIPDVDTAAIAIALSEYAPWELDKLVESMQEFTGGFAIHAVWVDHPDVSLIVRGRHSPMVLKYKEGAGLLYGSEEDSVFALTHVLHDVDDWETRRFEEYQAVLVMNGEVKDWRSFKPPVGTYNRPETVVQRLLPPYGERDEPILISEAEYKADWSQDTTERSLMLADADNIEEAYSLENGLVDDRLQFPCDVNKAAAKLSEADFVYFNRKAKLLYAFFGNIEIVLNEHGALRDVFNHDLFTDEQRWSTRPADHVVDAVTAPEETFEEFFKAHTTKVHKPIDGLTALPFKRQQRSGNVVGFPRNNDADRDNSARKHAERRTLRDVMGDPKGETQDERDERLIREAEEADACAIIGTVVDESNWYEYPQTECKYQMTFMGDPICTTHNIKYSKHQNPRDCDAAKLSALVLMSCVEELDLLSWMYDDFHINAQYTTTNCNGKCDWRINQRAIVDMDGTRLMLPSASECVNCGSIKTVERWASWVVDYLTGTKMRLAKTEDAKQEANNAS